MPDNPKILYVEDDKFSRQIMDILLVRTLGFESYTVFDDSADFSNRLDSLTYVPDVIFLDIHVDPIDGYEMLKICRTKDYLKNTPIVALTASIMAAEVDLLREAGFDGLIGKPIDQIRFPDLIKRIVQGELVWDEVWE